MPERFTRLHSLHYAFKSLNKCVSFVTENKEKDIFEEMWSHVINFNTFSSDVSSLTVLNCKWNWIFFSKSQKIWDVKCNNVHFGVACFFFYSLNVKKDKKRGNISFSQIALSIQAVYVDYIILRHLHYSWYSAFSLQLLPGCMLLSSWCVFYPLIANC